MAKRRSKPVKQGSGVWITLYRDGWTKAMQIDIGDKDSGYRLLGPKFNGSSEVLSKYELHERDAEAIMDYCKLVRVARKRGKRGK